MTELGKTFNPIQIPPEGMAKSPWAYSANPGKIDADKIANLNVDTITVSEGGYIRSGKDDFEDTAKGWYLGSEGIYFGDGLDATKLKFTIADGSIDFIGTISGKETSDIAAAFGTGANAQKIITDLINARIDTSAKTILSDFNFGATNYAGAVKAGDVTWNSTNGAITGGSGVVVYRGGIVGAKAGVATFTIDINGDATFKGDITGSTGTFGNVTLNSSTTAMTVPNGGAILAQKGSDIFLEGDDTNPAKIIFRNPSDTSEYWDFYMDQGTSAEFLYLLPNGLTYKDFWIGKYDAGGATDALKSRNMLRSLFVFTGNTLSGGSRPSIIFQNWNAYGDKWSRLAIGDSDTESLVEVGGDFRPDTDDTYDLGSSTKGWSNLYLAGGTTISTSDNNTFINFFSDNGISMGLGRKIRIGVTDYEPKTLNYKDHDGVNKTMNVIGWEI